MIMIVIVILPMIERIKITKITRSIIVMISIFTLSITVPRVIPIPDLLWPKINILNILR